MAATFQNATTGTTSDHAGAGGTDSVSVPASLASGELWVIQFVADADPGGTISVPTGFTSVAATQAGQEGFPIMRAFWKIAGSSESAASVTTTNSYICWWSSIRINGQDGTAPIGNTNTASSTGAVTTLDAPDITITNNSSLALLFFAAEGDTTAAVVTNPTSTTLIGSRDGANNFPAAGSAYQSVNAGSFTPGNWSDAPTNSDILDGIALTIEIIPAGAGGSPTVKTLAALGVG